MFLNNACLTHLFQFQWPIFKIAGNSVIFMPSDPLRSLRHRLICACAQIQFIKSFMENRTPKYFNVCVVHCFDIVNITPLYP